MLTNISCFQETKNRTLVFRLLHDMIRRLTDDKENFPFGKIYLTNRLYDLYKICLFYKGKDLDSVVKRLILYHLNINSLISLLFSNVKSNDC